MLDLDELLVETTKLNASDLHLSVGLKPLIRIYGNLKTLDHPVIDKTELRNVIKQVISESMYDQFKREGQIDFAYSIPGIGRFRGNYFRQARGESAAFRVISENILPLESLGLPEQIRQQIERRSGLILITGPTGSGKSTTLAAMINHLNTVKNAHILTIEDPIEYVHRSKSCLIHQRQIGLHSSSFSKALRAALREDPDIIMVGEMRDLETIELTLTAAETGHLVFGTLHTRSAAKTLDRLISAFPANQQNQVRTMAAESIRAIVSQVLLPRIDKPGMVPAFEILVMTSGVQNLVREMKIYQIPSAIQTGAVWGMRSMEQSLRKLVLEKIVDAETAREFSTGSHANEKSKMDSSTTAQQYGRSGIQVKAKSQSVRTGFRRYRN